MTVISKKILIILLAAVFLVNLAVPVLAQNRAKKVVGICNRLEALSTTIEGRLTTREGRLEGKRNDRLEKLVQRFETRDSRREENRLRWDENREEHLTKLEERAADDSQKQAVAVFREAVNTAVTTRRAATDIAKQTFRDSLHQLVASRQVAVDNLITTYQQAIQTAFERAKIDCAANVEPASVRENLKNDLKEAQDKFHGDRQAIDNVGEQIQPLIDARKAAVELALQDFKSAVETAKQTLKAAFGENE